MTFLLTWGFGHVFCLFAECSRGAAGNRHVLAVKLPVNNWMNYLSTGAEFLS